MPRLFRASGALVALLSGLSASAAVPAPPDQVAYSGVLVDGAGAPLAGPVDLVARLYDAASGGTLVFKQSFASVALSDGHYTVTLGPTGAASDTPADPLTTSLRTALTGNLAASPGRFVEITVDTNPPLARVQLVLVPYAMRADHATTADIATNALDAQALGGIDPIVLEAMYGSWNFDGGPPASDPSEGTADNDGDGLVNFVDSDNDGDTLSDAAEVTLGTNLNLVSPRVTDVAPNPASSSSPTQITVQGTGFLPGLSAAFGNQQFTPDGVTSTSFSVTVAPGTAGSSVNLLVTNPNAELHLLAGALSFGVVTATPIPFVLANASLPVSLVARGEELLVYGSGGNNNRYAIDTVTDGVIAFDVNQYLNGAVPSAYGWSPTRVLVGLRGQGSTGQIQLLRDGNADNRLTLTSEIAVLETPGGTPKTRSPSIAFDGAGRVGGGYVRDVGSVQTARAFHDRDANGSFSGTNEVIAIEAVTGASDDLGEAAFDASGRLAYAFGSSAGIRFAWDRSGDGDFDDSVGAGPELITVTANGTQGCLGLAFDTSGRPAIVNGASLLRDLDADGDFTGPGEELVIPNACDVTAASSAGRVVVATLTSGSLRALIDLNDDGDFTDAQEDTLLGTGVTHPIGLTETASGALRALSPQGVMVGPIR